MQSHSKSFDVISGHIEGYRGHIGGIVRYHECSERCRNDVRVYSGVFDEFRSLRHHVDLSLLHPLPVPTEGFESVAIDFTGPLPKDDGFDAMVTMTDRLCADIQIAVCTTNMTAEDFAYLFLTSGIVKMAAHEK